MKNLFKLIPAALGLFALASCNSDDFGSAGKVDLTGKAVLEVTDGDATTTRSFKTATLGTQYETGDVLRVYDEKMQTYYNFDYAEADGTAKFVYNGAEDLNDFNATYVLYGVKPENMSYAGWKDGKNIALLKVEKDYNYSENAGTNVGYKSILPMLGKVNNVDKSGAKPWLQATTYTLVARAKVTFKNGAGAGVKRVRARALKFANGKELSDFTALNLQKKATTVTANGTSVVDNLLPASDAVLTETGAPKLNGWFEAVLDKEITGSTTQGGLQACDELVVNNSTASNEIVVKVADNKMADYTNCVFFPIAPRNYDIIVFEYSTKDADVNDNNAVNWQYIGYATGNIDRTWKMGDFGEDNKAANDLTIETALEIDVNYMQNCEAVTKVMADNTIEDAPVIINLNKNTANEHVKTIDTNVESQYTIYIPQLKNNMTVNFKTNTILNKKLVIKDVAGADNSKYTVKFNFAGFDTSFDDIEISTTAKELKLEGNYSTLTGKDITVKGGNVTVTADDAPTTMLTLTNEGAGTIAVDGNATNNLSLNTLNAGTASNVKVNGAAGTGTTVGTLNSDDCEEIEVSGGTVTALKLSGKKAATIAVNGEGAVTGIGPDATLTTEGLATDVEIAVNSADNGIIGGFTKVTATPAKPGELAYNLSSKFTSGTTKTNATITSTKEIYTAAQLNSIDSWNGAAKLMTAVDIESGTWRSPNLAKNFDGNNKAITNLNAPLFGVIGTDVTSITKLNITGAAITATAANCGVIAKVSKATNLAVTASTVQGTISSAYNYVGGLIGQVDGSTADAKVVFGTSTAGANATATVTANVTLDNIKNYNSTDILDVTAGTWGEYVGSVVAATSGNNKAEVEINFDCAGPATAHTAAALKYNWKCDAKFESGRVQRTAYLKPTASVDGSNADYLWIGYAGTATETIPVAAPLDASNITLKYPMTVNGVKKQVTFPTTTAVSVGNTNYTFTLDGLGQNDKSGVKTGTGTTKTAVIYHNAYTATAYGF